MRQPKKLLFYIALIAVAACQRTPEEKKIMENLPFEMPQVDVPSFKTDTFNIADYGAVPDGSTTCTGAFAKAIEACSDAGGGVVLVPAGMWLTGPITLKSRINLHLNSGALIQFSSSKDDYPLVLSYYEGVRAVRCQSPITGLNLEDIAITGSGVIDGNGGYWRQVKKDKLTEYQWKELVASGGVVDGDKWYPSEQARESNDLAARDNLPEVQTLENMKPYKDFLRPVMVSLVGCKRVLLEGVTFQNSPAWNVNPLMCEHVTLRNLTIRNPWYSQNGDGLDLESCRIGTITNCNFDVGDDGICIKSGKDEKGRKRGMPTELFVIRDCIVYHAHGGFVVGSEMSGGVRKIFVSNCIFMGTDCGLRFKSLRGRGGVVEDIYMENIRMTNIATEAIRFNLFYASKSPSEDPLTEDPVIKEQPVSEATPVFRNMSFKNIICEGAEKAIMMQGIPEMPVENMTFENMNIRAREGISFNYVKDLTFRNVNLTVEKGNAVSVVNSKNIVFDSFLSTGQDQLFRVAGDYTGNIQIKTDHSITFNDIDCPENLKPEVKLIEK